jgi:hypothetical protein
VVAAVAGVMGAEVRTVAPAGTRAGLQCG